MMYMNKKKRGGKKKRDEPLSVFFFLSSSLLKGGLWGEREREREREGFLDVNKWCVIAFSPGFVARFCPPSGVSYLLYFSFFYRLSRGVDVNQSKRKCELVKKRRTDTKERSRLRRNEKKKKNCFQTELALKSIPHPGIFGGFGRNVFFLQYGDFIKKPEVLILLSKTTT